MKAAGQDDQLGDQPIQNEFLDTMNAIARSLDQILNGDKKGTDRTIGFVLLVFPFSDKGGEGRCNYISNANRQDVVNMMKEQIARFESQ